MAVNRNYYSHVSQSHGLDSKHPLIRKPYVHTFFRNHYHSLTQPYFTHSGAQRSFNLLLQCVRIQAELLFRDVSCLGCHCDSSFSFELNQSLEIRLWPEKINRKFHRRIRYLYFVSMFYERNIILDSLIKIHLLVYPLNGIMRNQCWWE